MSNLNSPNPSPTLIRAIRHVLCPLVRLMLSTGVTFPLVSELLKGVFVEVAERDFRLDERKPTDSRISLLTGVHRKDVRRLRGMDRASDSCVPGTIPFGARLVAAWLGNERFLDGHGQPQHLPRTRGCGAQASFEELVASHSTDCRPRVVLDEWLRLGIVRIDEHDLVVLKTEAFIPTTGLDEKLQFFAHHLHDHAAAATANLLGRRPAQLERSVMYEGLSEASIDQLHHRARQLGTRMLKELNGLAIALDKSDALGSEPSRRFTSGVYFYSEPTSKEPANTQEMESSRERGCEAGAADGQ